MKELTQYQKKFIIDNFCYNDKYSGYRNIAENLLTNGKCVVAGDSCIWWGGFGNFITLSSPNEGFVGCVQYNLKVDQFLKWVSNSLDPYIDKKNLEIKDAEERLKRENDEFAELYQLKLS